MPSKLYKKTRIRSQSIRVISQVVSTQVTMVDIRQRLLLINRRQRSIERRVMIENYSIPVKITLKAVVDHIILRLLTMIIL